jgi:SpoVK/Ycf46/Vps4 family AAA+-type ATPase
MRPGRFDYLIYVSPPDEVARRDIFSIYLTSKNYSILESVKEESVK